MIIAIKVNDEFETHGDIWKVTKNEDGKTEISSENTGGIGLSGPTLEILEFLNDNNAKRCQKKTWKKS